ncbi:MAG: hypothetical protein JNJ54_32980 [Myxococcaceae bacterium]|nr:hypothetical protein [Myxococcaceae bacterium]
MRTLNAVFLAGMLANCSVLIGDGPGLVGKKCTTNEQCGAEARCLAGTCVALDGGAGGGSTGGGSTGGGSTGGGSTAGGSTAGGSMAGGSTAGGSTAGGSTAGGSVGGGSTAGGAAGGAAAGGAAGGVVPFNNTWTRILDGGITVRAGMAFEDDADSGVTFLYGGFSGTTYQTDTWRLTSAGWQQVLANGTPPTARAGAAVAFDAARRQVVVHGGNLEGQACCDNTTWIFDVATTTWSQVSSTGPARSMAAMAFDPTRNVIFLFGGRAPDTSDSDQTWQFNGSAWTQVTVSSSPPAREAHVAFVDPATGNFFVSGGATSVSNPYAGRSDTWVLQGVGTGSVRWNAVTSPAYAPVRFGASIAYDPLRRLFVMFGGVQTGPSPGVLLNDTWTFDPSNLQWTMGHNGVAPLTSPSPRHRFGLTWVTRLRRTTLFGGTTDYSTTAQNNEVWVYGGP